MDERAIALVIITLLFLSVLLFYPTTTSIVLALGAVVVYWKVTRTFRSFP